MHQQGTLTARTIEDLIHQTVRPFDYYMHPDDLDDLALKLGNLAIVSEDGRRATIGDLHLCLFPLVPRGQIYQIQRFDDTPIWPLGRLHGD